MRVGAGMPKKEMLHAHELSIKVRLTNILFGVFLSVASLIAALAAITVLFPHGILVSIWSIKEEEYQQLLHFRFLAGGGFAVLSVVLGLTARGWFQYRRWAWFLFWVILAVNLVSDVVRTMITRQWVDLLGVILEGLILFLLTSRPIRNQYLPMNGDSNS